MVSWSEQQNRQIKHPDEDVIWEIQSWDNYNHNTKTEADWLAKHSHQKKEEYKEEGEGNEVDNSKKGE